MEIVNEVEPAIPRPSCCPFRRFSTTVDVLVKDEVVGTERERYWLLLLLLLLFFDDEGVVASRILFCLFGCESPLKNK